jgi:PAT family beta-lactamase induction signal transducer AmpG
MLVRLKQHYPSLEKYLHPRVLSMVLFGISAGVPYLLITSTLYQWLLEEGLSESTITAFAVFTFPFSLKVFWSHFIDALKIPFLHRFGQYRSWFVLSQVSIFASLITLSQVVHTQNILLIALVVLWVSFSTATQDITLGGYRVALLTHEQQPYGSGQLVIGYRIGILLGGGGALFLSSYFGWKITYIIMAFLQIQGMLTVFLNPEPMHKKRRTTIRFYQLNRVAIVLYKEFMGQSKWLATLLYIFLFKFGDATLNTFTWLFLRQVGFTKEEIAFSVGLGFFTNAIGATLASFYIDRFSIRKALYITAVLQICIFVTLWWQAAYPKDASLMMLSITLENAACGFAATCIYTLFAYKVTSRFQTIQYTFLASFSSFSKMLISTVGGFLLSSVIWSDFFAIMCIAPIVSMGVLYYIYR